MLSKLTVLFVAFTAALVGALPSTETQGSCSTGPVQCCNDVHSIDTTEAKSILKSYSVVVPVGTNVGFKCSPITGVGVGSSGCQAQTVCCKDNSFNGVIVVGCSPININV